MTPSAPNAIEFFESCATGGTPPVRRLLANRNEPSQDHAAHAVADAVLYEGYRLYPYRSSAIKNRVGPSFGRLPPSGCRWARDRGEPTTMGTELLLIGPPRPTVTLRFLQASVLREAVVDCPPHGLVQTPHRCVFEFGQPGTDRLRVIVELSAEPVGAGVHRIAVSVENVTPCGCGEQTRCDDASVRCPVSTQLVLTAPHGSFVSLLDPPPEWREAAAACRQSGLFPVLVGDPQTRSAMLASPIILYDFPQVAPESPGDSFDATEIDEVLALRILTLTDEEKRAMRQCDPRTDEILRRTEALGERVLELHGTLRSPSATEPALKAGSRVILRPNRRADAFDLMLAGKTAVVQSVEQDFDGRIHLAVTIDDDPGRDLGVEGKPGHRFHFGLDEVEEIVRNSG